MRLGEIQRVRDANLHSLHHCPRLKDPALWIYDDWSSVNGRSRFICIAVPESGGRLREFIEKFPAAPRVCLYGARASNKKRGLSLA